MESKRWKGFVAGLSGGVLGLLAMRYYWQQVAPKLNEKFEKTPAREEIERQPSQYDDISIYGKQYREAESAAAAVGRLIYTKIAGEEPQSAETKSLLSYLVHWFYGIFQGGVYGSMRPDARVLDLKGGLTFATGLWLFGDEFMVPLLGLQSGPTTVTPPQHLNRWGAHLAYGAGTAIGTQIMRRLL